VNIKKLVIPNIPYVLLGLYSTKIGEAWRMTPGGDLSEKLRNILEGFHIAFRSVFPSFYPSDLAMGILVGLMLKIVVYVKGKNAKKYRKNVEYGSARWGTGEDIRPYIDPNFQNNVILTQTERLTIRPVLEESLPALCRLLTDPKVTEFYMVPDFDSEEQVVKLFRRLVDLSRGEERYVRGIYRGETLVGFLNDVGITGNSVELGWVVHPRYHNQGCATAAVKLAVEELFAKGFDEVCAGAFEGNGASIRVMEKSGMKREDRTDEIEYRGAVHHCVYYSIRK